MSGKRPSDREITGSARKRKVIDLGQKMEIINKHERGQTLSSISRELGLATSTVNTILKDGARIKEHVKGLAPLTSTVITKQRSGAIYEMEQLLTLWMEANVDGRVPLSLVAIQAKARSIFEDVKGKYGDADATFAASHGWFNRFKARSRFRDVTVRGQAAAAAAAEGAELLYPQVLRRIIDEGGYTAPENPRAFKGISKATLPVYFRANPTAWVTVAIFEDWFINCFIPDVEKYCRDEGIPFKILLVIDNAPSHPAHLDDFHPNIKVVFLPPNATSVLQPMDQGVNAKCKAYYLRRTLAQALEATEGDTGKTVREFWEAYDVYQAVQNIAKAWAEVTQTCLNGAWEKMCPQLAAAAAAVHARRGPQNDETHAEVAQSIVTLAAELRLEVDAADVEELIESHGAELSNEDLAAQFEAAKVAEEARDEPADEPRRFDAAEMATAFREVASAMARFEKMDPNASRFLKVNRGIEEALAC
uniref:HTH CENPB-type domain-containing protein n=1 Tax=Petromyzon marinus TaxID=7757 RepID=S4RL09_PETMA